MTFCQDLNTFFGIIIGFNNNIDQIWTTIPLFAVCCLEPREVCEADEQPWQTLRAHYRPSMPIPPRSTCYS